MGVKDLWSVISPVCEKKSLWELRGKNIAIDLSAWVCDSQFANKHQLNMYLRNLFFRTAYLLQQGVHPIFILEGVVPELKMETIRKRIHSNCDNKKTKVTRSRLSAFQKQCVELLSCMGISCLKAPGEAEAFCSHLNLLGLVCGVVTQDSDAFLYGATEVYRNFQLSPQYTCDVYKMTSIEERLGLTRVKMVAFSLLTGCDYTDGVHNVGKETALKFVRSVPDDEIFERFQSWKKGNFFSKSEENKFCPGNSIEMTIRDKALKDEEFPNMFVVEEFLREPEDISLDFKWGMPDIPKFISFAARKLAWEEDYSEKKIIPLVTRWHLVNGGPNCGLRMKSVLKKRNLKGVQGYEVQWDSFGDFTTVEDKELVEMVYPDLVLQFEGVKKRKLEKTDLSKNKKTSRKKHNKENITEECPILDKFLLSSKPKESSKHKETSEPGEISITAEEDNELDLSLIINTIVNRPNSNPALNFINMNSNV